MIRILTTLILISGLALPSMGLSAPSRIKELADVRGVRENMLIGYGLVVGLSGTGDTQQVLFTNQSISGMVGPIGRSGFTHGHSVAKCGSSHGHRTTARLRSFWGKTRCQRRLYW